VDDDDENKSSSENEPVPSVPPTSSGNDDAEVAGADQESVEIYGDSSYGTAEFVEHCQEGGADAFLKVQPSSTRHGLFSKDIFRIDLDRDTVTCPDGHIVQIRRGKDGFGKVNFGSRCQECPLQAQCTSSKRGRIINIHPKERLLQKERCKQRVDIQWRSKYKATRPKIERKFGHLTRRRHGGRRARVRGCERVGQDFSLLAAVANLQRLATLGVNPI